MMTSYQKKLLPLLFALFFFIPTITFAADEASVTLDPKSPTPYTDVTATLVSYLFNTNTAMITWSINGKVVLKGIGERRLKVRTGAVGTRIPVHIVAETADATKVELDISVTPASVDILYETPESYTPLFYEGHSLPGEGATVKFVAMPNINEGGVNLPASSLSYSWYVNGDFNDSASGIGKQAAYLSLDYLSPFTTIKVAAYGPRGTVAEKVIDVYPHSVMPLLYTYDDVLGADYTSLIGRRLEKTKDFTLLLEPFYLSSKNGLQDFASYNWYLDGLPVTPLGGTLLSLRPNSNSYGSKKLSITAENSKRSFQKGEVSLNVIFDTRK